MAAAADTFTDSNHGATPTRPVAVVEMLIIWSVGSVWMSKDCYAKNGCGSDVAQRRSGMARGFSGVVNRKRWVLARLGSSLRCRGKKGEMGQVAGFRECCRLHRTSTWRIRHVMHTVYT